MNMKVAIHDHRADIIRHLWNVARSTAYSCNSGMQFSLNYLGIRLSATVDVRTEEAEVRRTDVDSVETATVEMISILPKLETVYDTVGFNTPLPTLEEALAAKPWEPKLKTGKDGWIVLSCSLASDPYTEFELSPNGEFVEVAE